ncbi:MAG TPA: transposase [Ignavibacteriaceae bacterium]|nr:transposase [Ignavibacteriaceae bacterium]
MNRERNFFKNTYHHLYNRGANKGPIFFEKENFYYFLRRLKYYKTKYHIEILSYCLMPNHFHLFVHQLTDEFTISMLISSLLNSYTKSVNKKYLRSGTLFESKTKSKQIIDDHYFKWIIKYIIENPVKAGLVDEIIDWEYSNAKDLLGYRNGNITDRKKIKMYFQNEVQMKNFLNDKTIKVNYEF